MLKKIFVILPIFIILLIPFVSFGQDEQKVPVYEGIWQTDRGVVALWQAENAVWGVFGSVGEIGGYIKNDGRLEFMWEVYPDGIGTGWFRLGDEDRKIEGYWYDDVQLNEHGVWNGTSIGPNNYELGDREALKYNPENPPEETGNPPEIETNIEPGPEIPTITPAPETPAEIAPAETVKPAVNEDAITLWSGTWETDRGFLIVSFEEDNAVGTFDENGVIDAKAAGLVLDGKWTITAEDGTVTEGEFAFWLTDNRMNFKGTYNYSTESNLWLVWSGKKVVEKPEAE
ncbi:MAG: hypothetical protein ABIC40_02675 [bacterium]